MPDHDYPSHIEISLTATDSRGLAATDAVSIHPRTVDLTIASDPPGLELAAGPLVRPAPFGLRAIEGSSIVLSAPPSAAFEGGQYAWRGWSDAGARVHSVLAEASATYTASYRDAVVSPPLPLGPPQGRIVKRPRKRTHATTAVFAFAASQPGARFRCKLDAGAYKSCRSPRVYRHLRPGGHALRVVAENVEGADPTPALFRWVVLEPRR